jgi:hypothetical protein
MRCMLDYSQRKTSINDADAEDRTGTKQATSIRQLGLLRRGKMKVEVELAARL